MTDDQQKRIIAMMKEFAGEDITVEQITSCLYTFGSELACLRIFAKYNANGTVHNKNARVGYSDNLKTWYFALDNVNLTRLAPNESSYA
jgi:hypothetical protein